MASIKLNQSELDALAGLGHAAFRLYVAAIRPRMDFTTGYVGRRVGISWQALREWMYVEPRPGVKAVTHTESMVRRLVKQLVKNGLLREIGDRFRIAFSCPLADKGSFAQKKADRGPTPLRKGSKANTDNDFGDVPVFAENERADTHLESGFYPKNSPPTPPALRAGGAEQQVAQESPTAPPDDNPLDETPAAQPRHQPSEQRHGFATAVGISLLSEGGAKRVLSWEPHLAWPVRLTRDQRAMVQRNLAIAPENMRDTVMDEWRGRVEAGGVKSPFAWLAHCAREACKPGWAPTYATLVREQRLRAVHVLAQHQAADDEMRQKVGSLPEGKTPKGVLAKLTKLTRAGRGARVEEE